MPKKILLSRNHTDCTVFMPYVPNLNADFDCIFVRLYWSCEICINYISLINNVLKIIFAEISDIRICTCFKRAISVWLWNLILYLILKTCWTIWQHWQSDFDLAIIVMGFVNLSCYYWCYQSCFHSLQLCFYWVIILMHYTNAFLGIIYNFSQWFKLGLELDVD